MLLSIILVRAWIVKVAGYGLIVPHNSRKGVILRSLTPCVAQVSDRRIFPRRCSTYDGRRRRSRTHPAGNVTLAGRSFTALRYVQDDMIPPCVDLGRNREVVWYDEVPGGGVR